MRTLLCYTLLAAFVLGTGPVSAQVNTERMRALDVEGLRTTLGGDVAVQSGNVDLFEVGATARVDARRTPHYAFFAGETRYGIEDGERFRDRTFGHLRYNYRLRSWLVAEAFTQLERDGFARLQLRSLAGAGLRVQYVDTKVLKIFQGTTPMYEYETLTDDDAGRSPATTSTVRWSNYLNARLRITESVQFSGTVYVQPRVDEVDDVRVLHQAALGVDVTEHVRLTAELDLRYDSRPPDTVESLDLALRNGLKVSF
jgi:putative salt-induced outer membrane protein YdiY